MKSETKAKEPVHIPELKTYCQNCRSITGTKVFFMRQGLGNGCDVCGLFRKGRRFLSKAEYAELVNNPERVGAEGGNNGTSG